MLQLREREGVRVEELPTKEGGAGVGVWGEELCVRVIRDRSQGAVSGWREWWGRGCKADGDREEENKGKLAKMHRCVRKQACGGMERAI